MVLKSPDPCADATSISSKFRLEYSYLMAQNSPKALYDMVFGPKSLKI